MGTHVFIVNNNTFPIHLQYLFAGTGAMDKDEQIGLLTDISRIRRGDLALFYIEGTTKRRGGFYGIFKVAEQEPLIAILNGEKALEPGLPIKLIYRTLLEPYEIYPEGVQEWEALDKLPIYATEIQWSLIYRKLKGKRGCTPLLPWEADRLMQLLRNKNSGRTVADEKSTCGFDWDLARGTIVTTQTRNRYSIERSSQLDVLARICEKQKKKRAYEALIQYYLISTIGSEHKLDAVSGKDIMWFGNEVACGVGMQKIDVMTISGNGKNLKYKLIELKDESVQPEVIEQLDYYVNWASQESGRHLLDAHHWNIQPVVVAPVYSENNWEAVASAFKRFNQKEISLPIEYFEFALNCERPYSIEFKKRTYE